jgi:hypothetical protein
MAEMDTIQLLIADREKERDKLTRRADAVSEQLRVVERDLEGLRATERMLKEHLGIQEPGESSGIDESLRARFADMTHKDVLIAIAHDHGGILKAKQACGIMVNAGVCKDERAAQNAFYRTVSRFPDLFDKMDRGKYRVIIGPIVDSLNGASADKRTPAYR